MEEMRIPQKKYFNLSAIEVLRGMVALYGFESVLSALYEASRRTPLALDTGDSSVSTSTFTASALSTSKTLPTRTQRK